MSENRSSMARDDGRREPERAALLVVYATVFLDLLGFGIILPSLPFFARELEASGLDLGILFTAYSSAQLVGAAILGRLSDRWGRRPVLLASLAGASLAMLFSGLAQTLVTLCLARALAGLFGGSIATAQAYVADVTRPEDRARYMGFLGAAIGSGFVFGPAFGAGILVLGGGFSESAFIAAGLAAANLIFGLFKLPESRGPGAPSRRRRRRWLEALGDRRLGQILGANVLVTVAFVSMETTFAYYAADRFALDERSFALILTYVGVIAIVVQGALIGRLTRRFGVRPVAIAGGLAMGLGLLVLPLGPTLAPALVALGLLAAGKGLSSPTLSTLVSQLSGRDEQGAVLGIAQGLAAGARAVGPITAGALYDLSLAAPYLLGGLSALLAAGLVASVRG